MKKSIAVTMAAIFGLMAGLVAAPVAESRERLVLQGSTTVLPITVKHAEEFMKRNPGTEISVRGGGSGAGIKALIEGTIGMAQASRSIRDGEILEAKARGIKVVEHTIAGDALAVIVHPENPVANLTKAQIRDIYLGKTTNWREVGGKDQKIVVTSRDVASGTFKAFNEKILGKEKQRPDALFLASSAAVVGTVTGTPGAIGYVGMGFLRPEIKALHVDGVAATAENLVAGKYPLGRPLFIYTAGEPTGLAKRFLDFIMSPDGQKIVKEAEFVPVGPVK
ncbi:MAG: PstS family phosphate ABC transporter substrate-binding protein [Desulfobulbaceae bacterium]|nr:MAG: PstS family phosphate ABC transporter substrate-binding protein [Desulfobulbaceae bacterium]